MVLRPPLRLPLGAALPALLLAGAAAALIVTRGRPADAGPGQDQLLAACRTPLIARLLAAGFQPDEVEFGPSPAIATSSAAGRTLTDSFTFADGALRTRVDGLVACGVEGSTVTVAVRTRSTPQRAT